MSDKDPRPTVTPSALPLLEKATAVVLISVLLALGWMIVVAYEPALARLPSEEAEALVVLVLLVSALLLVSVVALVHTG